MSGENKNLIIAFWFEDYEIDDESGFYWECPKCNEMNMVGDDFVWNGKLGVHATKDKDYVCEHCDSDEGYQLFRK